jgi:hypothetical protein
LHAAAILRGTSFNQCFLILKKKQKSAYEMTMLSVYPLLLTFECLNQSLGNLVCISWHLSLSQQHTSYIPPISLCVCMCIPLLLLGNRSVKTLQLQQIYTMIEELLDALFFIGSVSYQGKVGD